MRASYRAEFRAGYSLYWGKGAVDWWNSRYCIILLDKQVNLKRRFSAGVLNMGRFLACIMIYLTKKGVFKKQVFCQNENANKSL